MQEQTTPPLDIVIRGRYLIESLLGRSNAGATYLVRDQHLRTGNEDSAPVLVGLGLVRACDSSQLRDADRFHYKALEQYGGSIDVRSDVYALGATFCTLATASCHRVHKSRDAPKCDKNRRLKKIRRPRSHESKSDQEQIVPVRQLPLTILAIRRTFEDYIA